MKRSSDRSIMVDPLSYFSFPDRKEGSVSFNDTLKTFSYGYMATDHSDRERTNPLPPHD